MTSLRAARPRIITAFALLLIVGALVALPNNVFIGGRLFMAGEVSLARLSWSVVSKLGMVACGLGFLRMRKWAPFLYFGLVAATFASILGVNAPSASVGRILTEALRPSPAATGTH